MSRDIPAIDAIIAGFCSSHDEPNAAEQAIAFDQSLERSGWSIVRTERVAALEASLTPLARRADHRDGLPEDWDISVPLSELRAARKAIDGQQGK